MTAAPQHESAHGRPPTTDELTWEALLSPDAGTVGRSRAAAATAQRSRRTARPPKVDLLAGLNPSQREAVLHEGAPVLVVAGAGSGKTRVLTRRIAYLVGERKVHPGSVLAITFTNKAAAEMRHRVVDLIGNRAKLMWVSTFHSACVRILRGEINRFGLSPHLLDLRRRRLQAADAAGADGPRAGPEAVPRPRGDELGLDQQERAGRPRDRGGSRGDRHREEQRGGVRGCTSAGCAAANALDFDDLIMTTVHLLQAFPELREQYRRRFRHVLVDEYQDTNHAQYVARSASCARRRRAGAGRAWPTSKPPELMVVGDSDQSIYAFRGATIRNILDFEADFPGATHDRAGAELPLHPDHPERRQRGDRAERGPQAQEACGPMPATVT